MADNLSREERVAAGLKKLKQFQQRANKKSAQGARKKVSKNNPDVENSSEVFVNPNQTFKEPSNSDKCISNVTPSHSPSHTKLTSASTPSLYDCSDNQVNLQTNHKSAEGVSKSKSELNLTGELSSTESILQISQQINGLMSETHAFLNGNMDQDTITTNESNLLAQRNQELATQVVNLKQQNDHLQFQIEETKAKVPRLQREFEVERANLLEKSHKEQVALKDQLQVHIQTIGMLVAEKTELQSSLSLSQQTAKQKAAEAEELQGRLRGSRQRANDLERELGKIGASKQHFEKENKEFSKEVDRLKMDNYRLGKSSEELKQQNSEMSEKISKKISELQSIEKELNETLSQLSLSELRAQQLSSNTGSSASSQIEGLHHEKLELEKRISLQKESIEKLIGERDDMSEQYQTYVQQLSQQVTSLRDELRNVHEEKELLLKDKNLLMEKLELSQHSQGPVLEDEQLKNQILVLERKNEQLSKELGAQVSDNGQLSNLIAEQESRISELECTIQRMRDDAVDKTKLFNSIQSEKVAASRAVAQNMELKRQLEELQNGFISVSNDKLDLTEKLLAEHHITKELGERLSEQEDELRELKDQISSRDDELQNMHLSNTKGIYQQNQIVDRMRHYEAQGQLAETLQQELKQAQERIRILVNQNTELRTSLALQAEASVSGDNAKEDKDISKRNNLLASLSTSVRQLEMERNQLMKQLDEQKSCRERLEDQIRNKGKGNYDDVISKDEYETTRNAMQMLEERFKKTMDEIAELSEEKQRLEHVVTQLQGETETIGDYIALYQIQRGLMRKRAAEKDDYIAQLAKDREELKSKMSELQGLVVGLVEERKQYQSQGIVAMDTSSDLLVDAISADNIVSPRPDLTNVPDNHPCQVEVPTDSGTAQKIMNLLSEMETANFIDKPVMDNFHPCPLCSGRLITV